MTERPDLSATKALLEEPPFQPNTYRFIVTAEGARLFDALMEKEGRPERARRLTEEELQAILEEAQP